MKLVLFEGGGTAGPLPGLLTGRGVVDISGVVARGYVPQLTIEGIIDGFERLRPDLEKLAATGEARPLDALRLLPPLPRPGKILCCIGNYWEHAQREPQG
jgi:2-keto-4-pentenoate hydratase/2-oxohepta-3-ene-1,7-dioic acid hydratase in catechol pathway